MRFTLSVLLAMALLAPLTVDFLADDAIGDGDAGSVPAERGRLPLPRSDRSPPAVSITFPPAGYVNRTAVNFSGTASDDHGVTAVDLSQDNGTHWTNATDTGGASPWSTWNCTLLLADGDHKVTARAVDSLGWENRTNLTLTVDTVAPPLELYSPAPGCVTNADSIVVSGRTEPGAAVTVNQAPVGNSNGYFNTQIPLRIGWNAIEVLARDPAGNPAQASFAVLRDVSPPNLTVLAPENDFLTNRTLLQIFGNSDPDAGVYLNNDPSPLPLDPEGNFNATVHLTPGTNQIEVRARDPAGNEKVANIRGVLDITPPFLNAYAEGTLTNQSSVLVFGDTEPGSNVSVAGTWVPLGEFGNFSTRVPLAPGDNQVPIRSRDRAGNENSAIVEVYRDMVPPEVTVLFPAEGAELFSRYLEVCGTASDAKGITSVMVQVRQDNDTRNIFANGTVRWNATVNLGTRKGNCTIDVLVYDRAGNSARARRNVSYIPPIEDTQPPAIAIVSPSAGSGEVSARYLQVRGTARDPSGVASVQISLDNLNWQNCVLGPDGENWSVEVALNQGANTLRIRAWDTRGNSGVTTRDISFVTPAVEAAPNYGLLAVAGGCIVALAALGYYLFVHWRRSADQPEPGLGEDEALITFPGKGLK